jgi:glutamate/tyrosine decarboxylase-like PLP-dependent enzyme
MSISTIRLPESGLSKDQVLLAMRALREKDIRWRGGRAFSLVYDAGHEVDELLKEAYTLFFAENGLNPTAFPSLRQFETEVVAMAAHLLGGDENTVGNMTSGGTESLLLAVKTARDWARAARPGIAAPEIVLPVSAHPAFDKAAHYFDVKLVRTPTRPDSRADAAAMRAAITPNTILLVGSAPSYPHGVVDPVAEIAAIAQEHNRLCHVDACVGGFMLPFVRRLGYPVPDFDFRVRGVTSLSADLHKYGYAAKGASLLLYRDNSLRRHQLFAAMDWPGGIYASATIAGTRPGGAIAAAWAVLNYLGEAGYLAITDTVMKAATKIKAGVNAIEGLKVMSDPEMSVMAIGSDTLDIYEVGDEMTARGWHLDRQQFPPTLHLTVHFAHARVADEFLRDLAEAARVVRMPSLRRWSNRALIGAARWMTRVLPEEVVSRMTARASKMLGLGGGGLPGRTAAMYGMLGALPNRGDLREVVLDLVESFTRPQPRTD